MRFHEAWICVRLVQYPWEQRFGRAAVTSISCRSIDKLLVFLGIVSGAWHRRWGLLPGAERYSSSCEALGWISGRPTDSGDDPVGTGGLPCPSLSCRGYDPVVHRSHRLVQWDHTGKLCQALLPRASGIRWSQSMMANLVCLFLWMFQFEMRILNPMYLYLHALREIGADHCKLAMQCLNRIGQVESRAWQYCDTAVSR